MSDASKVLGFPLWALILGSIVLGVIVGVALNATAYESISAAAESQVLAEAYPDVDPDDYTIGQQQAQSKAIRDAAEAEFEGNRYGGLIGLLADGFLKLLRAIVVPLVFLSLASGVIGLGDPGRLSKMGGKTLLWYVTTSILALLTGLVVVNVLRPGVNPGEGLIAAVAAAADEKSGQPAMDDVPDSVWGVLLDMLPNNPIADAAEGNLFGVIVAAIALGVAILFLVPAQRTVLSDIITALFEAVMKITVFILALAPIGIFALIARLVAISGPEVFLDLIWYIVAVAVALAIHFFLTLPLLLKVLTGRSAYRMLGPMSPALLTGFSTASSSGTLPLTLERLEDGVGVNNKVGSFVLPLGATINMDGTALYEVVATIFVAQAYAAVAGFDLTIADQFTIVLLALAVSIGAAGIPSAGLVMMVVIFQAVGLPLELTALLWSVDRVLDMARTTTNIWSDTVGATAVAHFENEIDESGPIGKQRAAA
jgi:Na+/H+-dicarboxylate symporter